PRDDVVRIVGSEKTVERLERYGLIRATHQGMEAVSSTYQQMRQEGMVSFLERYVLPSLTLSTHATRTTNLLNHCLFLTDGDRDGMLPGPVQSFFEALSNLADLPLSGEYARLSVLVVGANEVQDHELDASESALLHLQTASKLRAASETRAHAVVSQFDCMADLARFDAISTRMAEFMDEFAHRVAPPKQANYQLMVASHWRIASDASSSGVLQ
ncbi:MAG: hypothetical protein AAFQ82_20400, partial [Myxococcota bacterium]